MDGCGRFIGPYPCCTIITGDARELAKAIPDESMDAVITDPPYGLGLGDWDDAFDPGPILHESRRVMQTSGFLAFFCQMPMMVRWAISAERVGFSYAEHIAWIKRAQAPNRRLCRVHESVLIYRLERADFYAREGPYEDVRVPGLAFDIVTIQAIQRQFAHLRHMLRTGREEIVTAPSNAARQDAFQRFSGKHSITRHRPIVNYTNVWSFQRPNHKKVDGHWLHPAEKPTLMIDRLVEMLTPPGGTVTDWFAGSGTVAASAKKGGYHYLVFEIDPHVAEQARERVRNTQPPLFVMQPEQMDMQGIAQGE